ncbi:MAG: hypothetical protein KDB27_09785 [Planctomycetales bacterium]|nr:hypothetical protein [Planctomycetales bacterium]
MFSLLVSVLLAVVAHSVSLGQDSDDDDSTNAKTALTHQAVVGPVRATVKVAPEQPIIGDVITVTIEVVSEPSVEILMPEFGEALDHYRILDFAPRQEIRDDGKTLSIQTYRLQPPISGKQSIPPILIEFVDGRPGQKPSPDDYDAYELLTPRIDFTVQSVVPDSASSELKPPLGELQINDGKTTSRRWLRRIIYLAALLAVALWRWLRARTPKVEQRSPYELARERLDALVQKPLPTDTDEADQFYVELSDIVRRYLEDQFNLRAPELTTEEFLEAVSASPDLSREHQQLLREFLGQADLVKFAGVNPDRTTIEASIVAANRFIDESRVRVDVVEAKNG